MEITGVNKEDAKELLKIYAPYVQNTAISFEYEVPSVLEFEQRIESISSRLPYLKAVENGQVIGYAYAAPFKGRRAYDWAVEVTVYVKQSERRRGVGKALYHTLTRILRETGVLNMYACIAMPKSADPYLTTDSIRFHEKMGFEMVGTFHNCGYKFDTWYDMVWMEKMIGDHNPGQSEVKFGLWKNAI